MGNCLPLNFLLQGVSLGPLSTRGNAGLQTPSLPLSGDTGVLSGDTKDLLLQVLEYSLLEDLLEHESGANSVPSQEPGERQEELFLSWG